MNRLTKSAFLAFSTGYSDCTTCDTRGIVFIRQGEDEIAVSCPECDLRDQQMEEVFGLDGDHRDLSGTV